MKKKIEKSNNYYYDVSKDLKKFPKCWAYLVVGGRNTGKTYSSLRFMKDKKHDFIFIKRTNLDVNTMSSGSVHNKKLDMDFDFDLSPFVDLNEDFNWNVQPVKIFDGLGGFFDYDADGELIRKKPIGYIFSLNRVGKFKGFGGLRSCDFMIFDEFIASPWDRVSREEGNQLLELYKTVSRDREHRGRQPLKLICLANANDISNPIFNTLQITDDVSNMVLNDIEYFETRGIMIHLLKDNPEFYKTESETSIYKAMHNTKWGKMAFDNEFSRNDFSTVKKYISIKKAIPICTIKCDNEFWYVYRRNDKILVTYSKHNSHRYYDFNVDGDRRRYLNNEHSIIRNAVTNGKAFFNSYRQYDVLYNFTDNFKI